MILGPHCDHTAEWSPARARKRRRPLSSTDTGENDSQRTNGRPATAPAPRAVDDDRDHLVPGARVILVIEDDPIFARLVADLAHELQFQCIIATTADDGSPFAAAPSFS